MLDEADLLPQELHVLAMISLALITSSDEEMLATVLQQTVTGLGYRAASLRLLDAEQQHLELKASYGLSPAVTGHGQIAVRASPADQTVLQGIPVGIYDVRRDPEDHASHAADREGLASVLAVPVSINERVIGVLRIYTGTPHHFSSEERALLGVIASLYASAMQRARRFTALHRMAQHVNAQLDLEAVLTTLLVRLVDELHVTAGSIRLLGSGQVLYLAAAYGLSPGYIMESHLTRADRTIDHRAMEQCRPIVLTEIASTAESRYPVEAQREGIRTILAVPLRVRATVLGVLRVYSAPVRHFTSEELAFATHATELGAIAVENARLHETLKVRLASLQADTNAWQRYLAGS